MSTLSLDYYVFDPASHIIRSIVSCLRSSFPEISQWGVDKIPDLQGDVMIVTGGNTGIGKETCKALLKKNAKVYLAARDERKALAAIGELERETGKKAHYLHLDLASLKSIKASAEAFMSKETTLHLLFNNAGVMLPSTQKHTEDGYDLSFGTNALGHFYFTKLLFPVLFNVQEGRKARVINTTSWVHLWGSSLIGPGVEFDTFKDGPKRRRKGEFWLYGQSKLANVIFTQELVRRYGDKVVSFAAHPGNVNTDIVRGTWFSLQWPIVNRLVLTPAQGAITQLWAGTEKGIEEHNGAYLVPLARFSKPRSNDPVLGRELWEWFEEQVKIFEESNWVWND
ncbi:NAD(P)-binding protein [Thelephora ganbajun]|uniref:NAD(P)-binding protein n=1 Tax=Thelephora ganbajun TaxID=370292 RepID=A0ACB6ZCA4_THEGA|nr:NAD(P)-binding protein [Thelephora ganbajun]